MIIAYFDCFAGAGGDMVLGALVDAGLPLEALTAELAKLSLTGYQVSSTRETRNGLAGTRVVVSVDDHPTQDRRLSDILHLISSSSLPEGVKQRSAEVFSRLASAEARVHGIAAEAVHFHEVGAVDAIVDIVGAVAGLHLLGVESCFCSALPGGGGSVRSSHGTLPVPAPATLELVRMAQAPFRAGASEEGEVLTPTAAAIFTTLAAFERPRFTLHKVGYGAGARDLPHLPNLLRVWIGETIAPDAPELVLLQTNIDDMSPEVSGYVMERLLEQGAADVWFTPIQMKKNRPAVMLSVLAAAPLQARMAETIFRETPTLGIRTQPVQRHEIEREAVEFESSLGPASVKVKRIGGEVLDISPEYEVCRKLALQKGLPLQHVYRLLNEEARAKLLP
ncbi:MAG: nickel pincer cofactor biosynthesis protein LarC [Dehalococcoidia bacterium]|nr:nickel pincer cofactor biosynthesis protein LarC [Dehalococcoidia bacterium]